MSREILDKSYYIDAALRNLNNTSRTAHGVIHTAATPDKINHVNSELSADVIAATAQKNYQAVIERLYERRHQNFPDEAKLREFVEGVALDINRGITKGSILIRQEDSSKYPYTRIADLEGAMGQFYQEFHSQLETPESDSVRLAAWVDFRVNLTDHFFVDGSGKTAQAISTWVLMRANQPLPSYRSYEEFYAHGPVQIRGIDPEVDKKDFQRFLDYVKSLY